jgi:hypothetical protein
MRGVLVWLIPLVVVWAFVIWVALAERRRRLREGEPPVPWKRDRPNWLSSRRDREHWRE